MRRPACRAEPNGMLPPVHHLMESLNACAKLLATDVEGDESVLHGAVPLRGVLFLTSSCTIHGDPLRRGRLPYLLGLPPGLFCRLLTGRKTR